jgi:hypothetical protein
MTVEVGVKVGDYVDYSVNVSGIVQESGLESIKAEIVDVAGTNVTLLISYNYQNGTTTTDRRTVDVSKEADFITSANLNVGDSRSGRPPLQVLTIDSIITRDYGSVTREVVYCNQTSTTKSLQVYYDRKTEFLVEEYYELVQFGITANLKYSLHSTNPWSVPSTFPSMEWLYQNYIYLAFGFIAPLTLGFSLREFRRRSANKKVKLSSINLFRKS